jgi:hypothetical protein
MRINHIFQFWFLTSNLSKWFHPYVPVHIAVPVPVDRTVHTAVPVNRTVHTAVPVDRTVHTAVPVDRTVHAAVPVDG